MVIAPTFAKWIDRPTVAISSGSGNGGGGGGGGGDVAEALLDMRRVSVAWGGCGVGTVVVLMAGLCMLCRGAGWSTAGIVLLTCVIPVISCAAGPFWALHHGTQPPHLHAISIALVNSVGNVGGFVGPYLLALLSTWLGPEDCPNGHHKCVRQWGWATVCMGLLTLLLIGLTAPLAVSSLVRRRRLSSCTIMEIDPVQPPRLAHVQILE